MPPQQQQTAEEKVSKEERKSVLAEIEKEEGCTINIHGYVFSMPGWVAIPGLEGALFEALVKAKVKSRRLQSDLDTLKAREKPPHKCERIATALMGKGRDWWLGKLTEPVKEWPQETHCLHMKTPQKDVVFLCNSGDFSNLLVLCHIVLGAKLNQEWIEAQMKILSRSQSGQKG